MHPQPNRREFLAMSAALCVAPAVTGIGAEAVEEVIDIHQHTNYSGRSNEGLIAHQKRMGVTLTILLPAGRFYGLEADCGRNDTVYALAQQHPKLFKFFANEVPDLPEAKDEITRYLKKGAIGIGEQKFQVAADSAHMELVAKIAEEYNVPVLMHFQHGKYNTGMENFHKTLEKFPKVNFIGHAQTWWANIDKNHNQPVLYPKGKVTPGGMTDRLLADYPNMFGDMSAGSGLNALQRDEEHARAFMGRHQDKLMYGSDCNDGLGYGVACQGAQTMEAIRRLVTSKQIERKILYGNAKKLLRL